LLCMLLSIITFGLVAICMFGMYYLTASPYMYKADRVGRYWTETSVGVFLGIVVCIRECVCVLACACLAECFEINNLITGQAKLFALLERTIWLSGFVWSV